METTLKNRLQYLDSLPHSSTCSIYFIIDGSANMFEINPASKMKYFDDCIKAYHDVLIQKCLWNSDDYMGLIVFGSNRDNSSPFIENVWVFHELQKVNMQMAKQMHAVLKTGLPVQSVNKYPILDAMRHASNKISSITKSMIFKKIVLFTCNDNPFVGNDKIRHDIRVKANSMKEMDLEFDIVGLNNNWNEELFWKDIRLIFDANITIPKSLSQITLDLQKPARILREVKLYLTEGVGIPVLIHNIVKRMKYLINYKVNAKTNKEVDSMIAYKEKESDNEDNDSYDEQEFVERDDVIYRSSKYGNETAVLSWSEKRHIGKMISKLFTNGIKVLGFHSIEIKPELHYKTPYFITWAKNSTKEQKMFFAALLDRCVELNVMAICVVRLLVDPKVFSLIPCKNKGGFYMYQIPFYGQLRNFEEWDAYKINENNDYVDENRVCLMRKMMNGIKMNLSECSFKNPKLHAQLSNIQALALEEENPTNLIDETEPNLENLREKIKEPLSTYITLYPQQSNTSVKKKGTKRSFETCSKEEILQELENVMKNNKMNECTVEQLKYFAEAMGISKSGRKAELINRIIESY